MISLMTSTSSVASTYSATCSRVAQTLNLTYGSAGTIITDLIHHAMKEEGVNKNLKSVMQKARCFEEKYLKARRG